MSDTLDVAGRMRAANPVPGVPPLVPPATVLSRITATPRAASQRPRRPPLLRRPLLLACLAVLMACGVALAANITVRYFDDAGTQAPPQAVPRALAFAASHFHPTYRVAVRSTVAAYEFHSGSGDGAVYMAPYIGNAGFCAALAVTGRPVRAGCMPGYGQAVATTTMSGFQPWNFAFAPDIHALLGRLSPSAAGSRVEVSFEDGTTEDVATHGRFFAYAVAGARTQAGHRPRALRVLLHGAEIWRDRLNPVNFNTLAQARGLVPAGNGSLGQRALRRYLLQGLSARTSDGGDLASHTEIEFTRLLGSVSFGHGLKLAVYGAPVRPLRTWAGRGGSLIVGVSGASTKAVTSFADTHVQGPHAYVPFGPFGCVCGLPGRANTRFVLLLGYVPRGVAKLSVRTADGREHAAAIFDNGREWVWVARAVHARRPVALIRRSAAGAVVAHLKLRGWG